MKSVTKMNKRIQKLVSRFLLVLLALLVVALVGISLTGCQSGAKNYGGTAEIILPEGMKLVNITWKGRGPTASLWYLVRPMKSEEKADTYIFEESSDWGVLEGTVIIREVRQDG